MVALFLQSLCLIGIYATLWYVASLVARRNDLADVAWGLGFVTLGVWVVITRPVGMVFWVVFLLVSIWGIRLAWHIGRRLLGKQEDFRYRQWREEWGRQVYWRSYLQVYLLQGFLLVIIAMPLLVAACNSHAGPSGWTWVGSGMWLVGFLIQAIADAQLAGFVRRRKDRSEVLNTGLWRYSRHPNYFGENVMWWALFIIVMPLYNGWIAIIGPITITYLLVYVSGVPLMEQRYSGHAGYEDYKNRTSVLVPWWPKRPG